MKDAIGMVDHTILQASAVRRVYRQRSRKEPEVALAALDVEIRRGQTIVIAGTNGAGKSTALRIFAGVDRADGGSVRVLGHSPFSPAIVGRVAYVPDACELFPFLNAKETLEFFASAAGLKRSERAARMDEYGRRLGVLDYGTKRVGQYSLGMRRRLGIAAALLRRPDLIVLDEPTAGLDPEGMEKLTETLVAERERGAGIVMSTHHLESPSPEPNEIIVLDRGVVAFRGSLGALATAVGERLVAIDVPGDDDVDGTLSDPDAKFEHGRLRGVTRSAFARWLSRRRDS